MNLKSANGQDFFLCLDIIDLQIISFKHKTHFTLGYGWKKSIITLPHSKTMTQIHAFKQKTCFSLHINGRNQL
jgi:hypothetical protein